MPKGQRKLEIAFESYTTATQALAVSEGLVSLHKIQIKGIDRGGAVECTKCPEGQIASAKSKSTCEMCTPGYEPNMECNDFSVIL